MRVNLGLGLPELHYHAWHGDTSALSRLLAAGINIDTASHDGRTALHMACANQQAAATAMLLAHGASNRQRDNLGRTAEESASGDLEIASVFAAWRARQTVQRALGGNSEKFGRFLRGA